MARGAQIGVDANAAGALVPLTWPGLIPIGGRSDGPASAFALALLLTPTLVTAPARGAKTYDSIGMTARPSESVKTLPQGS